MNQAFIDGQNLHFSTAKADKPWKVDLRRFRIYLQEKYHVGRAYYFIGYHLDEHEEIYHRIQEAGFIIVFRKHACEMASAKKGNVDTDVVFTVMRKIADQEKFNQVVLVSGDGDYFKMVQYLIKKQRFCKILAPKEKSMSTLYRNFIDNSFYDSLDRKSTKNKIKCQK
jgi:uncharacterized LabA/DUF88 family protein